MADDIKKDSKLVEYEKEVAKDAALDRINIEEIQLKLPGTKAKWVARLMNHKTDIDQLHLIYNEAIDTLCNKIIKDSPIAINKVTAERKAEEEELPKKIKKQIKEEERIVEYLEKTTKQFSEMSFDIKNVIEIIKLETQ